MAITIAGQKYKVIDSGGYNHDVGSYWKVVETPDGQHKMIVGTRGRWRFWAAADRVRPLKGSPMKKRFDEVNPPISEMAQRAFSNDACQRCKDTGWLPAIDGADGSYATSRPCNCEAGENASRLKPW